jgi:hypothetical protein
MVIVTRSFLAEVGMLRLVSPRIMLLETGYKLVELVRGPRVGAQQRSKIYGDVVHLTTSSLIRAYKMG